MLIIKIVSPFFVLSLVDYLKISIYWDIQNLAY
jgi:hypothetical protein